jgi:hypothetical protein
MILNNFMFVFLTNLLGILTLLRGLGQQPRLKSERLESHMPLPRVLQFVGIQDGEDATRATARIIELSNR